MSAQNIHNLFVFLPLRVKQKRCKTTSKVMIKEVDKPGELEVIS